MDNDELLRYSRHILLSEFGYEGQEKLAKAKILLIGAGGVGSPCAMYLAGAGVAKSSFGGKLIIADNDIVDLTNLQRQILYTSDEVNKPKASSAKNRLQQSNPNCNIEIVNDIVDKNNFAKLAAEVDIVLDATDRFATRHLINSFAIQMQKTLIIASAIRYDAQLMFVNPKNEHSACYECVYPIGDGALEETCATMGVFAPTTGVIGAALASETIKYFVGMPTINNEILLFNLLHNQFQKFSIKKRLDCKICKN